MLIERRPENRFPVFERTVLSTGSRGINIDPISVTREAQILKTTDGELTGELTIDAGSKVVKIHFTPDGSTTAERLANGYLGLSSYFKYLENADDASIPDYFIGITPVDKLANFASRLGFQDVIIDECDKDHRHVVAKVDDVKSQLESTDPESIQNLIKQAKRRNPNFNTDEETLTLAKFKIDFEGIIDESSKHAKISLAQTGATLSLIASYTAFCIYTDESLLKQIAGEVFIIAGVNAAAIAARRIIKRNTQDMISFEINNANNNPTPPASKETK